jgi:dienelactone hydrolase
MRRFNALLLSMCFVGGACVNCSARAVHPPAEGRLQLAAGQLIETVICEGDPEQSYALYLPSNYTTTRRWPIVYAFDPGGHGNRPVELYKDIAEKYGFVIAGSNNSRNFSGDDSKRSMSAIWQDTHSRLTLDEHRIYTTGFSGGARVAGAMALSCRQCQIAGVIAHGAGYPSSRKAGAEDGLLYFFAIGDHDFNWPEVIGVRREREERGLRYRVRTFSGPHQWAPVEIMQDAIEWMMLNAMRLGQETPDAVFMDKVFRRTQGEAEEAEKIHDRIAQLTAYRSLISDFGGLKDVGEYEGKLAGLKKSAELKISLRKEQEQMAEQRAIEGEVSAKFRAFADGNTGDLPGLRTEVTEKMSLLKGQAEHAKNEAQRLVSARAFMGLWVEGIESGRREFELRHFDKAEAYFQLMSGVSDDPWPALLLAETRTAQGNKKQAIKDLREAVRRGLKDPEVIENDDRLQRLKAETEFQKIVEELERAK